MAEAAEVITGARASIAGVSAPWRTGNSAVPMVFLALVSVVWNDANDCAAVPTTDGILAVFCWSLAITCAMSADCCSLLVSSPAVLPMLAA